MDHIKCVLLIFGHTTAALPMPVSEGTPESDECGSAAALTGGGGKQAAVGEHGGAELGQHPVLLWAAAAGARDRSCHAGRCLTTCPGVPLSPCHFCLSMG